MWNLVNTYFYEKEDKGDEVLGQLFGFNEISTPKSVESMSHKLTKMVSQRVILSEERVNQLENIDQVFGVPGAE